MRLAVAAMSDLYRTNRWVRYVAVFQNWLRPAGASFDHLHKQLVGIDERGVSASLELQRVRSNPNLYNEMGVDYAAYLVEGESAAFCLLTVCSQQAEEYAAQLEDVVNSFAFAGETAQSAA